MRLNKSKIHKILVISLSNIGDVILTFPAVDALKSSFPHAEISLVVGPKAEHLLRGNPNFKEVIIYNKQFKTLDILKWIMSLRKQRFDCVVDLRQTAIPLLLGARYSTPVFRFYRNIPSLHMKEKHLSRLKSIIKEPLKLNNKFCLVSSDKDKETVKDIVGKYSLQNFIVLIPGAASREKQWPTEYYAELADNLIERDQIQVVLAGSSQDQKAANEVHRLMKKSCINLCGQVTLLQLSLLMSKALIIIGNDTGPLHLASYLNLPSIVLFGPTNPLQYGPWGDHSKYLQSKDHCLACQGKRNLQHDCMRKITPQMVSTVFQIENSHIKL